MYEQKQICKKSSLFYFVCFLRFFSLSLPFCGAEGSPVFCSIEITFQFWTTWTSWTYFIFFLMRLLLNYFPKRPPTPKMPFSHWWWRTNGSLVKNISQRENIWKYYVIYVKWSKSSCFSSANWCPPKFMNITLEKWTYIFMLFKSNLVFGCINLEYYKNIGKSNSTLNICVSLRAL